MILKLICNHNLIIMIRATSLNESKFYRHWFMYRLNKLRGRISVANFHKSAALGVRILHSSRQLLAFRANADAMRVNGRWRR